jgi:hypothetical protein
MAQDISGAVTLGYAKSDVSDISQNIYTNSLDARAKVNFDNGVMLGANANAVRGHAQDLSGHITGSVLGVQGGYQLPNSLRFGVYAEKAKLDVTGLGTDLSATSAGITAGYDYAGVNMDGFIGRTTTNPDLPSGVDVNDYGIALKYAAMPKMTVGGSLMRTRISDGGNHIDLDLIGVAGTYEINDQWTAFGGLTRTKVSDLDAKVTTFGLGVSYDMTSLVNFASTASLEYANTKLDVGGSDGSLKSLRLGVTIPFGKETGKVPMNSVADSILNPTHSALSSTVLSAF